MESRFKQGPPSPEDQKMSGKSESIVSLQYLRALAAAMVLFEHTGDKSEQVGNHILGFYHHGYTGVDVFFVISGFIMSFIFAKSLQGAASLADFWRRRFVRIMPLYWVLSLVALGIFLASPGSVNSSGGDTAVWKSFFLIPGEGERFLIANGWTLSYEMLFYAVFSLSFLATTKALGFAAALLLVAVLGFAQSLGFFWPSPIVVEFSYGIAAYLLYRQFGPLLWSPVLMALGAAGLIFQEALVQTLPDARFLTAGLPAALLVYGAVSYEERLRRLPLRWLEKLGDSSYSMYLFHPFVLKAAGIVFAHAGLSRHGTWLEALFWLATAVAVFGVSHLVYLYLEIPLIKLARRWFPSKARIASQTA